MKRTRDKQIEHNRKSWELAKAVMRAASAEERACGVYEKIRQQVLDNHGLFSEAIRTGRLWGLSHKRLHKAVRDQREWAKESRTK
jgi:hypothetical protein